MTQKQPEDIEDIAFRKVSENRTLRNRLGRQWRKLIKESLRIAKEQDLQTIAYSEPHIRDASKIELFVINEGSENEMLYDEELLRLSQAKYPSLYRRYQQGIERLERLRQELSGIQEKLLSHEYQ